MKKITLLTILLCICFSNIYAQTIEPITTLSSLDNETTSQDIVYKKAPIHSKWLSPVQNWEDRGAIFNEVQLTRLYPDSFVVNLNSDSSLSYHNAHLVGTVFQPSEPFYELQTDGRWQLSRPNRYIVDSVRFPYAYIRPTDSMNVADTMTNIVDTAIVHFYKYEQLDDWYMSATDDRFLIPKSTKYDAYLLGPTDVLFKDTLLLTKELASDTNSQGNIVLQTFQFAIPKGIKDINDGNKDYNFKNAVGVSVVFKPMQEYTIGDTIYSRIKGLQPTKKLNNFGISSFRNDGIGMHQESFYNNSFICDKWVRYGQSYTSLRGYLPTMAFFGYEQDRFFNFDFRITIDESDLTIGVKEESTTLQIDIYPNPISLEQNLYIKIKENVAIENISITMSDVLGNVVSNDFAAVAPKEFSLVTDKLAGGVYLITVKADKKSATTRIVIAN